MKNFFIFIFFILISNHLSSQVTAEFSVTVVSGCSPLTANFTNESTGGVETYTYLWDFGDGNITTVENPTHTFGAYGSYTIALTVTDGLGFNDSIQNNQTFIDETIDAEFSSPQTSCTGEMLAFTDLSTGTIIEWSWDFGDGSTSTMANPEHIYENPGTYSVSLLASGLNCNDEEIKTDYITVSQSPMADFIISDTISCSPLTLEFTSLTLGASSWMWDFGDGNTSTDENPQHIYESDGAYTICLVVSDGMCSTNSCIDYNGACGVSAVPTMGTWGIICLSMLMLIFSTLIIKEKSYAINKG